LRIDAELHQRVLQFGLGTKNFRDFTLHDGKLLFRNREYVHEHSDRLAILQYRYDSVLAGHFGMSKTYDLISRDYWWPGIRSMIRDYVKSCETCDRAKTARRQPFGLLLPLPISDKPWSALSMDFIVKLPLSRKFDSILVVVDRFNKMAHFVPCRESSTSADLANLVFSHVFKIHGLPSSIISDRVPQFVSQFWKHLLLYLRIDRNLSSARHPQTDGQTERVNQILEQY